MKKSIAAYLLLLSVLLGSVLTNYLLLREVRASKEELSGIKIELSEMKSQQSLVIVDPMFPDTFNAAAIRVNIANR